MLIITRKPGERVVIGRQPVTVSVLAARNGRSVRLMSENDKGAGSVVTLAIGEEWSPHPQAVVRCCDVARGQVKLGITAPRDLRVDREEVYLDKLKRRA